MHDLVERPAVQPAERVIVHQMTALTGLRGLRKVDQVFAASNELRTRGTDNLLAAAAQAGTRWVIAQSYAGPGPDKPAGGALKTEEDPLEWRSIPGSAQMPAAITYVDTTVPRWPTWAGAGVDCLREVGRASG